MIQRRILVISALTGLLGGGGAILFGSTERGRQPSVSPAAGAEPRVPRFRWARGQEAVYRFHVQTRGTMNVTALLPNGGAGREDPFEMSLSGELVLSALDETRLGLRLCDVAASTVVGGGPLAGAPTTPMLEAMRGWMAVTDRGDISGLRFSEGLTPEARGALRQLLSLVRVTMPGGGERDYDVSEEGLTAPWRAHYHLDPSGSFDKSEILDAHLPGGKRETGTGQYSGRLSAKSGALEALGGRREKSTRIGAVVAETESTTIDLTLVALRELSGAELARIEGEALRLEGTTAPGSLRLDADFAEVERAANLRLVKDETIDGVLARMSSSEKIAARDVSVLKQLVRLDPKSAVRVLPELVARNRSDKVFQNVAAVLNLAGTPESQEVLRRAARAHVGDEQTYASLMTYLGTAAHPTRETEALLAEVRETETRVPVRQAAELALGALAHSVRGEETARAELILDGALQSLAQATADGEVQHALLVVGNVGLPSQVAPVEAHLADTRVEVRELAAWSLRFVESEDAVQVLLSVARGDPEDTVRARAVSALGFTSPSHAKLSSLERMLADERSVLVTGEVLRQLARQAEAFPEVGGVLRAYAGRCGNRELCQLANQLIARLPS